MRPKDLLLMGASAIATLSTVTVARAQSSEPAASAAAVDKQSLSEIVVTARRSAEKLLDTPIFDQVFTAETIAQKNIVSFDDIALYTPGFDVTHSQGSRGDRAIATYSIRGMTPGAGTANASTFIDGAPVPTGLVEGIEDAASVEVLKGPQSAAFGRSVFSGALSITTKTPSDQFHASATLQAGSYNSTDDRFSVEGPLIPGKLSARVQARYYSTDGQYVNGANPSERLGDQETKSVNASLYATPTDRLTVKLTGIYSLQNDGASAVAAFVRQDYNCDPGGPATYHGLNYVCGTLSPSRYDFNRLAQNDTFTPLFVSSILSGAGGSASPIFAHNLGLDHPGLRHEIIHTGLSADYKITSNITLSSLSSWTDDRYSLIHDYDNQNSDDVPNPYYGVIPGAPPTYNWLFNTQSLNRNYSQEFRLRGVFGSFRGMLGASYNHNFSEYVNSALSPYGPSTFVPGDPQIVETSGIFFSTSYDFLSRWTINFDGRYQVDKVTLKNRAPHDGPFTFVADGTFKNFVPRVILQYKPNALTQIYASYSEGVNPGTFNSTFNFAYTPAQLAYISANYPGVGFKVQPETLKNYELGFKGEFFDRRLQFSSAVYYAEWDNQIVYQNLNIPLNCGASVCSLTSAGFYTNIGQTAFYGFEFDGIFKASNHLTVNLSASYNESNIKSFATSTAQALTGNATVKDKELPNYSPYSANLGAEWRANLAADVEYYARADYIYRSSEYDSVVNLTKTEDTNLVNVRLGLARANQNLEFFVTNLFNDKTFQGIETNTDLLDPGFGAAVNAQLPDLRRIGVRFKQTF